MNTSGRAGKIISMVAGLVMAGSWLFYWFSHPAKENQAAPGLPAKPAVAAGMANPATTNPAAIAQTHHKIKRRASEFSAEEKAEFQASFEKRYKPALLRWCRAYGGHLPFAPEAVTLDKFVERIGKDASYRENIFVVAGITLGIQDVQGSARVDYLNDPQQTQKLAMPPDGTEAPILNIPVNREEVMAMLLADGGTSFTANEVRMTPSGFSGSLNGGVLVHVGGNPENAASWKYDLVFTSDGKLAYYLKGR